MEPRLYTFLISAKHKNGTDESFFLYTVDYARIVANLAANEDTSKTLGFGGRSAEKLHPRETALRCFALDLCGTSKPGTGEQLPPAIALPIDGSTAKIEEVTHREGCLRKRYENYVAEQGGLSVHGLQLPPFSSVRRAPGVDCGCDCR